MDGCKGHSFGAEQKKSGPALGTKLKERVKTITFWFTK